MVPIIQYILQTPTSADATHPVSSKHLYPSVQSIQFMVLVPSNMKSWMGALMAHVDWTALEAVLYVSCLCDLIVI